ncbi:MAG: hypothetical protein CFE25_05655 [Chitinophagaceae bacterium BSSC1]|nr:MAG: hypothetical protein CFE25_05655 [Chitinophagaceae bacterium BSSC1]
MLKTACFFTGDNYHLVSVDTPASKKKITALALAMILPIILWFFNGFLLTFQVLEAGFNWALLTAFVCALVVFFIEKLVIMANGNRWLTLFRLAIGFIVAALGSVAFDEVVFKSDIDISVKNLKKEAINLAIQNEKKQFDLSHGYNQKYTDLKNLENLYLVAVSDANAEADGSSGTKKPGVGVNTIRKDQYKDIKRNDFDEAKKNMNNLELEKINAIKLAGINAEKAFKENALLIRIKALFTLVSSDIYMAIMYSLFTLLLFFFEFLVVILKLTWKKTNYERKIEMIEKVGEERINYLLRKGSPLYDSNTKINHLNISGKEYNNSRLFN